MQNPRSVSQLLMGRSGVVGGLKAQSVRRAKMLQQVRAALPERLAAAVVTAGMEHGKLTLGVVGAGWATRLRYSTETLRAAIGASTGIAVLTVRIKVIQ